MARAGAWSEIAQSTSGRACLGAVVALAICATRPELVRAERISSVELPPATQGPEPSGVVESALTAALAERDFEVVDGFELARAALEAGAVPEADLVPFRQAEQLLAEGWRSYLEVRASFAAARLAEARTLALRVAHLEGGRELVAEISLRLGVVKLDLERGAEAADDFRLSHMLAPDRAVTDSEFKPEAVLAYREALAASSGVHVRTLPKVEGLTLHVDGAEVSGGEVRLSEGLHLVEARRAGYYSRSKLVSVSPGDAAPLSIELEVDPVARRVVAGREALSVGTAESAARQHTSAMFLYSQTQELVLFSSVWRRGAPAIVGQRCAGQPARCTAVVEIGYPQGGVRVAAAELWSSLEGASLSFPPTLQVDARVVSSEQPPGETRKPTKTPLWKNRWLWLGAATAAVAGGAVYLLAEPDAGASIFVGNRCDFGGCP